MVRKPIKKALEIAKANGIENPNLIHAGHSLNLCGLNEEEPQPQGDQFEAKKCQTENTEKVYENLISAQKEYQKQLAGLETEKEPETSFQFAKLTEDNTETDYINSLLNLVEQDIKSNDKEDENGIKDGVIDFEEFKAQQLAFYRATYDDLETDDDELSQLLGLQDIYNMYDIDKSGVLEANEIAFSYMAADANFHPETFGLNPAINIENQLEFDGIIDFNQMLENAQNFNDDYFAKLGTDNITAYENIYNKVSHLIIDGLENKVATVNTGAETKKTTKNKKDKTGEIKSRGHKDAHSDNKDEDLKLTPLQIVKNVSKIIAEKITKKTMMLQ